MKTSITPVVCWAIVLGLFAGGYYVIVKEDLATVAELERTYLRKKALLQRLQELPDRELSIKRKLADLGNDAATRHLYEGDHNAVQSNVQLDLRNIASESSVAIDRMTSQRASRTDGPLAEAKVDVSLTATNEGLIKFLSAIEAREPLLSISKLGIRVQRPSTRTEPARLSISAEISGYRRQGESD